MPFTFSHPAIILPLTLFPRKWFSLSGLIIGSLTPDFEYFIRMKIAGYYGHTIAGLFWFDLPLAILLAFIFHGIVRNSLIDNLPFILKSKFIIFKKFCWNSYFAKNWFIVIVSVLIGAASHLFWDSFTHHNGYFVENISFLEHNFYLFGKLIPVYKIAQHLSSLIGLIIVAYSMLNLTSDNKTEQSIDLKYWFCITILSAIILTIRFLVCNDLDLIGNFIVSCIASILLALILTPFVIRQISHSS